jgi:hypothetical protein
VPGYVWIAVDSVAAAGVGVVAVEDEPAPSASAAIALAARTAAGFTAAVFLSAVG